MRTFHVYLANTASTAELYITIVYLTKMTVTDTWGVAVREREKKEETNSLS